MYKFQTDFFERFFYEQKIKIGTENILRVDINTQLWSKLR